MSAPEAFAEAPQAWSCEAEQSVLGGLLMDAGAFDAVGNVLSAEDFFDDRHRIVYRAIAGLVQRHKAVDVVTVFDALQGSRQHEDAGGMAYLHSLSTSVYSANHAGRYAEIVAEKAAQRRIVSAADKAMSVAKGAGSVADKLDAITAAFVALERDQQRAAPVRLVDLLAGALDRYQALADGVKQPGVPTGFGPLDRVLNGGLRPGKVYGIAARPSVGKSSVARSMLVAVARAGHQALLLSQEMPAEEVTDCLLSELGRIDSAKLQIGDMAKDDWSRLVDAIEEGRSIPIHIDEQGGLTLADIRAKARAVKGLKVLALDYLQLCTSTLKGKSTNDEVAEISKGLKALALELGIPIIVLSQLNRALELRADKEPVLSDLRDSGAIEQDLDVALLLWSAQESDESRLVGFKVAKHRGGRKGIFGMRWQPASNQWFESAEPLRKEQAPSQPKPRTQL